MTLVDILGELINFKDQLNNRTLMHYLYVLFERNYPELIEFSHFRTTFTRLTGSRERHMSSKSVKTQIMIPTLFMRKNRNSKNYHTFERQMTFGVGSIVYIDNCTIYSKDRIDIYWYVNKDRVLLLKLSMADGLPQQFLSSSSHEATQSMIK